MYKFTVFTIIFSIIVVFVVVNLVITDFRQDPKVETPIILSTDEPTPTPVAAQLGGSDDGKVKVDFGENQKPEKALTNAFWQQINVGAQQLVSREYSDRIFSILSPTSSGVLKVHKNFINSGDLEGTEIYEVIAADDNSALNQYNDFLNTGGSSVLYSVNANDSFGDRSFYLNDELKPEFVFLIILRRNVIYAFAYPKEKHEKMISIYNLLP